ncbi:AN1-type zinc finger protein TMC1 [Astathelohania contejeani]|uniref:AN1-type zinc finger protein TMC1 n=1 Tax=Astathelohania contejeani TaxID=164912 RepID=A0ABQ7HW86_9MICR|nr:AN1-type zinc finger protein TMC1 [Thelohania contejeani]
MTRIYLTDDVYEKNGEIRGKDIYKFLKEKYGECNFVVDIGEDDILKDGSRIEVVKKRRICKVDGCRRRIVGYIDCKYCKKEFCSGHQMPESHLCTEIKSCREDAILRNKEKLLKEKCKNNKV